ncbi:MAG: MFS transporter [Phycisphaerales bacterium]
MTTAPATPLLTARLSVMMFLQFFVWGGWYVSQTGFMNDQQMGGLTSAAYSVGPIAAILSPILLGMIADRFFATERVLAVLHVIGGIALCAAPRFASAFDPTTGGSAFLHPYIIALAVHMLCYMPTLGLTTSLSMTHLSDAEKQFPRIRVWGTIGWIAANIVVGGNLKTWGLDVTWIATGDKSALQYYIAGGAGILLGLFALSLPRTPPPLAGKSVSVRELLGLDALSLLAKPSYLVFVLCSFLLCIPLAGYYNCARNFVEFTGYKNPTLTMTFGQISEIVFMVIMPFCFARLGVKWMLAVGMLAWVARYGLFTAAADDHIKWMVLAGIVLHGVCYDFFFVTGMVYAEQSAPRAIRGQSQSFLVLVTQGLGMLVGAQAFGKLVTHFTTGPNDAQVIDWKMVWLVPAGFAALIMLVFIALFKDKQAADAKAAA